MMQIDMILSQVTGNTAPGVVPTTWNPSDKGSLATLSNGNLSVNAVYVDSGSDSFYNTRARSIASVNASTVSGLYWELRCNDDTTGEAFGVATAAWDGRYNGVGFWGVRRTRNGDIYKCGYDYTSATNYDAPCAASPKMAGDVYMFALKGGELHIGLNGVWFSGSNPVTNTGAIWSGVTGAVYAATACHESNTNVTANFGASAFVYPVPAGFSAGFGAPL